MPVFLSFFPKIRHSETGSNCDVLTLKRTSFSTFFVVGRSNHLPTTSAFSDKYRQLRYIPKNSKSIWQQCHVGSNPTVCAKSSTLRGAVFYFCGKLCKGCKVGFEQPVPGALRPAGLQQSCGLLQGRGRIPPPTPSITTQFYIG